MEFSIDLFASLEIRVPKAAAWEETTENFDDLAVKKLKNGETKLSMVLLKSGMHDFTVAKEEIVDRIRDSRLLDLVIASRSWIKFELYDSNFISIFLDSDFLEFLNSHKIEIHFENRCQE
ncbi:MAG: hypothetical protein ABJN65_11995 [Parasphingorhabdus sp.]